MAAPLEADLDALLVVWRRTRAPEVADAMDRVSDVLVAAEPPIRAVGSKSAKMAWYAAIATKRAAVLPRLLEAVAKSNDRILRLRALRELVPDPRIGTYARTWLTTPAVLGQNRAGFYYYALDLIEHVNDIRLTPVLTALAAQRRTAIQRCGISNYRRLVALAESMKLVQPTPLAEDERALLSRVESVLAAPTPKPSAVPAELFASIYADPADNDARAVLADLLSEQGDPRGEFINLQLARYGTNKRVTAQERRLAQTWGRAWLGALEPAVMKGGVEFERGFVSRARYSGGNEGNATIGAQEWSTVAALDTSQASQFVSGSANLLVSPTMKSLREVLGITEHDLATVIFELGRVPWPTLGFHVHYWNRLSTVVGANRGRALLAVKFLRIANAGSGVWQIDVPTIADLLAAFSSLEEVELELQTDFDALVAHDATKHLRRITLFRRKSKVTYDRAANAFLR